MSAIPTDLAEQLAAARVAQADVISEQNEAELTRILATEAAKRLAAFDRAATPKGAPAPRQKRSAKRAKATQAQAAPSKIDRGPAIMLERGDIVREERPDPDKPMLLVPGARRRDNLREMWKRGTISDAQWDSAARLRADLEHAAGASDRTPDHSGVRGSSRDYGPRSLQIDAQARARGAMQAVGLTLAGILSWAVIGGGSLDDFAKAKEIRRATVGEMLQTTLNRLSDFYSGR